MPDLSAQRVLRRILGARRAGAPEAPAAVAVTGRDALAALEALVAGPQPAGGLPAAVGLALSGVRATAFVSGPELVAGAGVLADAVARRAPLVVHLAGCGSHAAVHAAAASGAAVLVAASAQEAVDLALAGRRLAEEALLPVVVCLDPEAGLAVQEVALPGRGLVGHYLGRPGDTVHATGLAQEMLLGRHRRRLPAWHDPARPLAGGTLPATDLVPVAAAARRAYLDGEVPALLAAALATLGTATGRPLASLAAHRAAGARVLLLGQGTVVETAGAVADRLHRSGLLGGGLEVGVVAVKALRPFPAEVLVELLRGTAAVAVLERVDAPLDGEGPLTREVRSAAARLAEAGGAVPRVITVLYGLGGSPLRAADLELVARELLAHPERLSGAPRYLGVDLTAGPDPLPKRQVLADALRRAYPRAAELGRRARGAAPGGLLPAGAFTVAFRRSAGAGEGLAAEAAALVHAAAGGHLRGRTAIAWERWGRPLTDRFTWSPTPLADPGDDVAAELAVCLAAPEPPGEATLADLAQGGALLLERPAEGWRRAPTPAFVRAVEERAVTVWSLPAHGDGALRSEHLLGALAAVLGAQGRLAVKRREVARARRGMLETRGLAAHEIERRLAAHQAGRDRARPLTAAELRDLATAGEPRGGDPEVPAAVRRGADHDVAGAASLVGLWDRLAGGAPPLPDPVLATGSAPARAALLSSSAPLRGILPAFDPAACTGCGACWTACPHGAIGATVLPAQALLDFALSRAAARGASVDAVRMVAAKLVAAVNRRAAELPAAEGADADDLFAAAGTPVIDRSPLPEERKAAARAAFTALLPELRGLPVARTAAFFGEPEAAAVGSGELFLLAVDPDSCKGCGGCVEACEPQALTAVHDDATRTLQGRAVWEALAALPAPAPATVERAAAHPEVGPLAAALLGPAGRGIMVGGDGAEAGSGEALAVRLALGAAAAALAPRRRELASALDETAEALADAIRGGMAMALPTRDLDALARGLAALELPEADLGELAARVEKAFDEERVDVPRLRRLVDAAREVADLRRRLAAGDDGRPEPPFSLVVGPGPAAAWAGSWPGNPFAVPVSVAAGGDAAALARGVAEGQLRRGVETAAALRRARLVLAAGSSAGEARLADELAGLEGLTWRDLTAEERRRIPPLLLVASEDALLATSLPGLLAVLGDELPVKVLLLAEAHLGVAEAADARRVDLPAAPAPPPVDAGLLALVPRRAFVAQSSCGAPGHLAAAVGEALSCDGPGLVRIHAPSPERHGFAAGATVTRAATAVASRVWPLFTSSPAVAGEPRHLSLAGNPSPTRDWSGATPAEWATGERRFAGHFAPGGGGEQVLALADYLALPAGERAGKVPAITRCAAPAAAGGEGGGTGEGPGPVLHISAELARAAEDRLGAWRTLRGMALELEAEEMVAVAELEAQRRRHQTEMAAAQAGYEERLAGLQWQVQVETARRLRDRLLQLASRRPPPEVAQPAAAPPPAGGPNGHDLPGAEPEG